MRTKLLVNGLTFSRIIMALVLLTITPFSRAFYLIYTYCGVSDGLDGWLARKTHSESKFGAKLDSFADLIFVGVSLFKLFPSMYQGLPSWVIIAIVLISVIRFSSYVMGKIKCGKWIPIHTVMNKLTGGILFILPYVWLSHWKVFMCIVASLVAVGAACEEWVLIWKCEELDENVSSLLSYESKPKNEH